METRNAVVVRRKRFDRSGNSLVRSAPPSVMVLQKLADDLTRMNEKIDAIALRQTQLTRISYSQSIQVDVNRIDTVQREPSPPQTTTKKPRYRVLRSTLLDLFE